MFPYDTEEVQGDAHALLRKMTGRDCPAYLALLSYVDEKDERGCKIIFQMPAPDVATVGRMLSASVLNMANVVAKVSADIRAQLGDEMADEFVRVLAEDVKEGIKSKDATLKQVTQIIVGGGDQP